MHNNAFILKRYAEFLNSSCVGAELIDCVSTSPSDIHFLFSGDFCLSIRFYKQHTFFILPEASHFPKKNVNPQFKNILGKKLAAIIHHSNDRGIRFKFGPNDLDLHCHGRRSGLLLSKDSNVLDHFKTHQPPDVLTFTKREVKFCNDSVLFRTENQFVTEHMITDLDDSGFFKSPDQKKSWDAFNATLDAAPIYICLNAKGSYVLTFYPTELIIETYADVGIAQHEFGKLFMAKDRFDTLQTALLTQLNRDIKKLTSRQKKVQKHLEKITTGDSLKEIADIIMANLHSIPERVNEVTLFNFYSNQDIVIQLKDNLNAQKNAERYYQKSKNIHKEIKHNEQQLKGIQQQLKGLEKQQEEIESATSYKQIQSFDKTKSKTEASEKMHHQLPYRT
ncbi:MAG: hypothetical protein ACI9JN_002240, partial [Bacteroidia bacterium]